MPAGDREVGRVRVPGAGLLPIARLGQPQARPQHETPQQLLERPRRDPRARLQTQSRRAAAVPRARLAVLLALRAKRLHGAVRPDVIGPFGPEILRSGGRRGQIA